MKNVTNIYVVGRDGAYEIQKELGSNAWNIAVMIFYVLVGVVLVVLVRGAFLCEQSYMRIYKKRYSRTSVGNVYK